MTYFCSLLQVVWLQKKGTTAPTILTANADRVTDNPRFSSSVEGTSDYKVVKLHISDVGPEDEGHYICQIPSVPPVTVQLYVTVIGEFQTIWCTGADPALQPEGLTH